MRCRRCCSTATPIWTTPHCRSRPAQASVRHQLQLGQDLLAQTLRGMQKSHVIGICVAIISATIAATVGIGRGLLRRLARRRLMCSSTVVGGAELPPHRDRHDPHQGSQARSCWLIILLGRFGWMISSRMVRGLTMSLRDREFVRAARYMGVSNRRIIVTPHRAERRLDPDHRHHARTSGWRYSPKPG